MAKRSATEPPAEALAAPALPARIEPTEANPEPLPQTSGAWVRDADGGLRPLDALTAEQAGLAAPAETTEPAPE